MSRKLKFKIISCSSQEQQYPVSSLLFTGSEGWQTRRFCTYPQQITLQFYGIVNIRKIQLVSDHRKISSQVDILYYVPVPNQDQRFYKYGYLQFNRNDVGNVREVKTIMVDINCLYLRFLFHKPHPSKQNFFSQIGLKSLSLMGSDQSDSLMQQPSQVVEEQANEEQINEEDERYIQERVSKLTLEKQKAISQEDYETANYYKNSIHLILDMRKKLRINRAQINKALENEDFQTAKILKAQIDKSKEQISSILEDKYQSNNLQPQLQQNQFAQIHKSQAMGNNEFMDPVNLAQSRQASKPAHSRVVHQATQPQDSYDDRVIPTLRAGHTKTEPEQQDEKPKPPPPVEEVQGKYIKDATIMQQFFDEQTVKKFFSAHWQHNLDSLTSILQVLPNKNKDSGLIKCLITIVKYSSRQINFQVALQSLNVFQEMLKINGESQALTKPGDQINDLDQIGKEVVKKLTDNNLKLKSAAERSFGLMNSSLLYGVQACSLLLSKSKAKLASKQLATRIMLLSKMIGDYGLGTANSVPMSALDFAIENCNNPSQEVRKLAIGMLSTAYKKDSGRTDPKLLSLKQSIQQQIRQGGGVNTPQKHKKK